MLPCRGEHSEVSVMLPEEETLMIDFDEVDQNPCAVQECATMQGIRYQMLWDRMLAQRAKCFSMKIIFKYIYIYIYICIHICIRIYIT